jgi:hypothetical protein
MSCLAGMIVIIVLYASGVVYFAAKGMIYNMKGNLLGCPSISVRKKTGQGLDIVKV